MISLPIFLQVSDHLLTTGYILYRVIQTEEDHHCLQQDLDRIIKWTKVTKQWQMDLNIDKCAILTCSRSISPPKF